MIHPSPFLIPAAFAAGLLLAAGAAPLAPDATAAPASGATPLAPDATAAPASGATPADKAPGKIPEDPATSGSSTEPLSDKLDRQGGVIRPPAGVDREMTQPPPAIGSHSMPVIPPPGTPGGKPAINPR